MNCIRKTPLRKSPKCYASPRIDAVLSRIEANRADPLMESLWEAFEEKNLRKVRELLASGLSVNYMEEKRANRTPLLYAAKYDFVEAVDELLKRGADPKAADDSGITPIHAAASRGNLAPLNRLLIAGVDPNIRDKQGKTPLHHVTQTLGELENNNALNIVSSLIKAGAKVSVKDAEDKTPLHSASLVGNSEIMTLLLSEKGTSLITQRDKYGRTPLHLAVWGARSLKAVELLLQLHSPMDAKDQEGRTPLHYVAARPINYVDNEFDGECLKLLLSYGAPVHCKDDGGRNALSLALQRTMWWQRQSPRDNILQCVQLLVTKGCPIIDGFDMWRIVETFPSMVMFALNQSIRTNTSVKDSPHLKLILDFRPLTVTSRLLKERKRQTFTPVTIADEPLIPPPLLSDSEISMLHYIFWAGHKHILRHPLCSAFLHLKWLKVRKFFILHVIMYFLFVLTLTSYVMKLNLNNSTETPVTISNTSPVYYDVTQNATKESDIPIFHSEITGGLWLILIFFSVYFLVKETLQVVHSPSIYIRHYENYLDISILFCVLILLFKIDETSAQWFRNISTIAIICSWSRLMLFLGQFPSCGVYIVMFSKVCRTVLRFLAMYLPLLIAFSLGFFILLGDKESFQLLPISFVTTLVMMVGEIDFKEKFLSDGTPLSKIFPCLTLIVFLLLVYIILSNLLVALAVNDLHSIQQRSELLRLSRQVELMVTVEGFLKSPFVPTFICKYLQRNLSICGGHTNGVVAILPNKKPGYVERLFIKLLFVFKCQRLLIKIFEYFVVNFIPPDFEPSLPKSLVQEATQLALNELEIEKRDKLLLSKSHQISSLRYRSAVNKTNKNQKLTEFESPLLPRLHDYTRPLSTTHDDLEVDPIFISHSNHALGTIEPTPSIKASYCRATIRREAFRNLQSRHLEAEKEGLREELDQLRKTMEVLQTSINYLSEKLDISKPNPQLKSNSCPNSKQCRYSAPPMDFHPSFIEESLSEERNYQCPEDLKDITITIDCSSSAEDTDTTQV